MAAGAARIIGNLVQRGLTYESAITLILQGRFGRTRSGVLEYFHEDEHGNAGRALNDMVIRGVVGFDGLFYRMQGVRNG